VKPFKIHSNRLDIRGSEHHSVIHIEITNKMQHCIEIYYSIFKWGSTCLRRHTAHHQALKTALSASGFAYVRGCWTLRYELVQSADCTSPYLTRVQQCQRPTTSHVYKTRSC